MAEASISIDQEQFRCPVCLDLLKDPVTIHCGHSYCMVCINGCWDEDDQRGVYSCPQCRQTFTPRPVLHKNYFIAEMLEKVKKTTLQVASPALCYAGSGDVECDFCTGRKLKAIKSCLVCVASLCETHLKPHLEIPALIKHKLVKASTRLQEKICPQHDEVVKIYCRTDQSCICYMCMMHEHRSHDTVAAAAERTEKQSQLIMVQRKTRQRLQEKEKKLQELKQAVDTLKCSAQAAVEVIVTSQCQWRRSEVINLIRVQEKKHLSQTEELLKRLEQEIDDLKRRNTELEELSLTDDHIHFIQSVQALIQSSGFEDSSSNKVHRRVSSDGVRKSISDLKERAEKFCKEEFIKIPPHAAAVQKNLSSELKNREEFLQYFCRLTLDPNTVNHKLSLSEQNRLVKYRGGEWRYADHPERFDSCLQVLCKECLSGHCYFEVEWRREGHRLVRAFNWVSISVSYKGIRRKGEGDECKFGRNSESWRLLCSSSLTFYHNNIRTEISSRSSSRIGVYVDHSAGTLSFYSVSNTMTLLHTVHTTFTQPLYAGFEVDPRSSVRLCDSVMEHR